jgi:hypothetical protein
MSGLSISIIVFACVFGGALVGILIYRLLPKEQLSAESKDIVRLGMGLVATMVALVLGLLVGSAKSFYDNQNTEVTEFAANVVLLDRALAHYGPEAAAVRTAIQNSMSHIIDALESGHADKSRSQEGEVIYDMIQELSPRDDNQRSMRAEASSVATQLARIRWLVYEQKSERVPMLLLVMLVFWLTALFVSFGLYAPRNPTVVASLFVAALAVTGTILLIVELYHPSSLIRVSYVPLRSALAQLGR